MALAVAGDGHVAVSLNGSHGPQLALLAPSAHGLIPGGTFSLPGAGRFRGVERLGRWR